MRVVFRTDASLQIGTGHVMRCLTLAQSLRDQGAECLFVCRELSGNLIELIESHNFVVISLPAPCNNFPFLIFSTNEYSAWLGIDWAIDAAEVHSYLNNSLFDWLVVDHYALDIRWENAMRSICRKVMVIDDLAEQRHNCDLLLDQNLGRSKFNYEGLVPADCCILGGPSYALLRPEFSALRKYSLDRRAHSKPKHLLISMGGVDAANGTSKVLQALLNMTLPKKFHITVVMGPYAPWIDDVRQFAAKIPVSIEIKYNVDNMAELMAESDLSIGAAGSTSWERCCLGLPAIIGIFANNQICIADALQNIGAAKLFVVDDNISTLCNLIADLLESPDTLIKMGARAAELVDGNGVNRVVKKLFFMGNVELT